MGNLNVEEFYIHTDGSVQFSLRNEEKSFVLSEKDFHLLLEKYTAKLALMLVKEMERG